MKSPKPVAEPSSRKKSKVAVLAEWFWKDFLGKTTGMYTDPKFFRYMAEAKRLVNLPPVGRGFDVEVIQRTLSEMGRTIDNIETMYAIDWRHGATTWYEYMLDPMNSAPPIYDTLEYQWWRERNAKPTLGSPGGDSSGNHQ